MIDVQNASKNERKIINLQAFNLSFLIGKGYFNSNSSQNYLIFQPVYNYFQMFCGTDIIFARISKGLSGESIETCPTSGNSFIPKLTLIHKAKIWVRCEGNLLN